MPGSADAALIDLRGVSYAFGSGEARRQILFEIDLVLQRGEFAILTGPSGSGKTTLLSLVGALRRPQQGHRARRSAVQQNRDAEEGREQPDGAQDRPAGAVGDEILVLRMSHDFKSSSVEKGQVVEAAASLAVSSAVAGRLTKNV